MISRATKLGVHHALIGMCRVFDGGVLFISKYRAGFLLTRDHTPAICYVVEIRTAVLEHMYTYELLGA